MRGERQEELRRVSVEERKMIYSVTEVLQPWADFSHVPPERLFMASERGTAVHDACLMKTARGIPAIGIDEECAGYVESFQKWFDHFVDRVFFTEERLVDVNLGISGQIDLFCKAKDGTYPIIDLKTPVTKNKSWRLQLAGYRRLVIQDHPSIPEWLIKTGSLRLDPKGKAPKMDWYKQDTYLRDLNYLLQALNLYRYFHS